MQTVLLIILFLLVICSLVQETDALGQFQQRWSKTKIVDTLLRWRTPTWATE